MAKLTLTDLANLQNDTTATNAINSNSGLIETAVENTLSRDGTSPNAMGDNFDMNGYQILNLPAPTSSQSPVRLMDVQTVTSVPSGKELLSSNRTYYVRTDGSDSNNGLSNSAAGAWKTLQYAANYIQQNIEGGIYKAVVQVGPGTYSGATINTSVVDIPLGLHCDFVGDNATPSNVIIDCGNRRGFYANHPCYVAVTGFKFISTGTSATGIVASSTGATIVFDKLDFGSLPGAVSKHIAAGCAGRIIGFNCSYTISGSASMHIAVEANGFVDIETPTVTLSGTPAFSTAFAEVQTNGIVYYWDPTFLGTGATGKRFLVYEGGVISTSSVFPPAGSDSGIGLTGLPGDAVGVGWANGMYDNTVFASTRDTVVAGYYGSVESEAATLNPLQSHGTDFTAGAGLFRWQSASGGGPKLILCKSRNDTIGSHTIVSSGDTLGGVIFNGSDGSQFVESVTITGQVDAVTPSSLIVPGRLNLNTASSSGVVTVGLRINSSQSVLALSPTGGLGYGTGAGGTQAQGTSRTTAVTLNKVTGAITLFSTVGSATPTSFTVNNSAVVATDTIIINQKSGTDKYQNYITSVSSGAFQISVATTGTTTEAPVFNFAVIKGVTA